MICLSTHLQCLHSKVNSEVHSKVHSEAHSKVHSKAHSEVHAIDNKHDKGLHSSSLVRLLAQHLQSPHLLLRRLLLLLNALLQLLRHALAVLHHHEALLSLLLLVRRTAALQLQLELRTAFDRLATAFLPSHSPPNFYLDRVLSFLVVPQQVRCVHHGWVLLIRHFRIRLFLLLRITSLLLVQNGVVLHGDKSL